MTNSKFSSGMVKQITAVEGLTANERTILVDRALDYLERDGQIVKESGGYKLTASGTVALQELVIIMFREVMSGAVDGKTYQIRPTTGQTQKEATENTLVSFAEGLFKMRLPILWLAYAYAYETPEPTRRSS